MNTDTTTTPPETPAPKTTKNVLRIREIVALHEWVTAHAADCRITPDSKLAAIAQAELEFTVTAANIAGMRAEIGIEKARKEAPPSVEERLDALERRVLALEMETKPFPTFPLPPSDHPSLPGMPDGTPAREHELKAEYSSREGKPLE